MAKILGKSEKGYLVSMSTTEIANWAGYYYGRASGCPTIEPGAEIMISEVFSQLNELERNAGALRSAAEKMRAMAAQCELIAPIVWPEPPAMPSLTPTNQKEPAE